MGERQTTPGEHSRKDPFRKESLNQVNTLHLSIYPQCPAQSSILSKHAEYLLYIRMDGWRDGWMDGEINKWAGVGRWMDRQVGGWISEWKDEQMVRWMDGQMWRDGQLSPSDKWMGK